MLLDNVKLEMETELSTTSFTLSSAQPRHCKLCESCFLELIGRFGEGLNKKPETTAPKRKRESLEASGKSESGEELPEVEDGKELAKTLRLSNDV